MGLKALVKANSIYKFGFLVVQSLFILILSRLLGPESFGLYSLIMVNAAIFNLFTGWGISSGIMYHASVGDFSFRRLIQISNWSIIIQLIFCLFIEILFISYSGTFYIWPSSQMKYGILGVTAVMSLALMERGYAFFNGYNILLRFHKISFYITFFIFSIVLYCFVNDISLDWKVIISIIILIQFIQSVFTIGYIHYLKRNEQSVQHDISGNFSSFYSYSILSFIGNALWLLISKIDILVISKMATNWDLGQYALASRFSQFFFIIPQFFSGILFPWFCSVQFNKNIFELLIRLIFLLHILMAFIFYISANTVIPFFFGDEYQETIHLLLPVLIGSSSLSVQILFAGYFASQNKIMINIKTMLISLIILVSFEIILIPQFGIWGASIALAISYVTAFIYVLNKYYQINKSWNFIKPRKSDFYFVFRQLKHL